MKLFGSKIIKDKNGENFPHLEITDKVLVHSNIVNNNYQQNLRVLCTFIPNKSFGQFLDISPKIYIFYWIQNFHILNCVLRRNVK